MLATLARVAAAAVAPAAGAADLPGLSIGAGDPNLASLRVGWRFQSR